MLFLKLWRRVRQESCESEIPIGGGVADIGIFICIPRRVVVVKVHSEVPVRRARTTVLDSSMPVTLRDESVGRDHSIGVM